ncbi:hypothetical protein BGX24_000771 [Mortierella sp. AD032]|nr:hypothetical protein BGX24_000771 [Mortierella sp. AD032]
MASSSHSELEDAIFIAYLFERIFFESIARLNTPCTDGTNFHPIELATKLDYISRFYAQMSLKPCTRRRGEAMNLLGLNTAFGVTIYLTNHRHRLKVLPDSFAKQIRLDFSSESKLRMSIFSPALSPKDMVDIRQLFTSRVPENYREEIEYLMGMMRRNGLWEAPGQLKKNCQGILGSPMPIQHEMKHETYVENSSAKGINISDFDLELIMTYTRGKKLDNAMDELLVMLKCAGYKSVHLHNRYSDELCQRDDEYVGFYDPKSELTCQITLVSPIDTCHGGTDLRDMMQSYADIDNRVEPFIFAVQKILDKHGRSRQVLSNLAVTMIAIHYLQFKSILPQLLSHQNRRANFEFYSGPDGKILPEDTTVISDERMLAEWPKDAPPMAETLRAQINNKRYGFMDDRNATNKKRGKYTLTLQELWEAATGHRMILTDYDKQLAKIRPFDKSPSPLSLGHLLIDFFKSTATDFKEWETHVLVPKNPGRGFKGSVSSDVFTGLVVQDPFVLQLNLTSQCTGWKFMSTSKTFQRADETLSGGYRRRERSKKSGDVVGGEESEQKTKWLGSIVSRCTKEEEEENDDDDETEREGKRSDRYFDGFCDARSGTIIQEIASRLLFISDATIGRR